VETIGAFLANHHGNQFSVPKASFTIANISFRLQNTLRVFILPRQYD